MNLTKVLQSTTPSLKNFSTTEQTWPIISASITMSMIVEIIGYAAGAITTLACTPQLIKTIRMKQTRNLSMWFLCTLWLGLFLWIVYGILKKNNVIIISNVITFTLYTILIGLKLYYDSKELQARHKRVRLAGRSPRVYKEVLLSAGR